MNQALNPSSIRFYEPVELPVSGGVHLIARPLNGHLITAVPFVLDPEASEALQARYAGHWVVIERDPSTHRVRESRGIYASASLAYYAYWHATEDDPMEFESWTSELFSASASASPPEAEAA